MSVVHIRGARGNGPWWAVYTSAARETGLMLSTSGPSACLSGGIRGRCALVGLTLPFLNWPNRTWSTNRSRRQ